MISSARKPDGCPGANNLLNIDVLAEKLPDRSRISEGHTGPIGSPSPQNLGRVVRRETSIRIGGSGPNSLTVPCQPRRRSRMARNGNDFSGCVT